MAALFRCASAFSIPTIVVNGPEPIQPNEATLADQAERLIVLDRSPDPWQHPEFSERVQSLNRDQLILLGNRLDPSVTFAALGAVRLAIDVFLIVDLEAEIPEHEVAKLRLTRLRQYGVVAIDVRQAAVELAVGADGKDTLGPTAAILKRFGL